jgi:hypothetical protein
MIVNYCKALIILDYKAMNNIINIAYNCYYMNNRRILKQDAGG